MVLKKEHWTSKDVKEFQEFLKSLKNEEKIEWTRRIINTQKLLLAIPTPRLRNIAKEIAKGNYEEFLNLKLDEFYENSIINGFLICELKDFNKLTKWLNWYALNADCWAECDLLKFNKKLFGDALFDLAKRFTHKNKVFERRIGVDILFQFIDEHHIDSIFNILNSFTQESEYYVNMCLAWLFAECFTKQREKTLEFLMTHKLNAFVINKGVQKCRDSYRISKEDKEFLLQFKVK